jgi:hypothetical protein
MSNICNIAVSRRRGSTLLYVMVAVLVLSLIVTSGFALLNAQAYRVLECRNILARGRAAYGSERMLAQAVFDGVQSGGSFASVASKANAAAARLGDGIWTTSISNVALPAFTLGDRAASFGATDGSIMQVSGVVSKARINYVTATATLVGQPGNGATVTVTQPLSVAIVEVPATEFQFIVSDQAFQQSASTNIVVSGKALFNQGISPQSPSGLSFDGAITSYGLYFGPTNIPSPGGAVYPYAPVGNTSGFTRAISTMGNLVVSPASPVSIAMVSNQALSLAPNNSTYVSWTNPAIAPANLPTGVSLQTFAGVNRLVVDLTQYYGYQTFEIDCNAATQANGVVVLGSPSGNSINANPVCITTTGALMLVGPNARPAMTGTSYSLSLAANTTSPTASPVSDVLWAGYVCLTVPSPTISTPVTTGWGGHHFVVQGTFAFPGGILNNSAVPMLLQPSATTRLALTSGNLLPDRLFFVETR